MNKKNVLIALLVLSSLLLVSCSPRITNQDVLECNEGKYSGSEDYEQRMKDAGTDLDFIRVTKISKEICELNMVLKKPMVVLGSKIKAIPVECDMRCINNSIRGRNYAREVWNNSGVTDEEIINGCCD